MSVLAQYLIFNIDGRHHALPLSRVQRVIHAVEPTPLPDTSENIMGIINMSGKIIPVFNLRKRFRRPQRELALNDCFIIASTAKQTVALAADSCTGVIEREAENAKDILESSQLVNGISYLQHELVLIQDLDKFLTSEEEINLENALAGRHTDAC